jgi:hypothetical protein
MWQWFIIQLFAQIGLGELSKLGMDMCKLIRIGLGTFAPLMFCLPVNHIRRWFIHQALCTNRIERTIQDRDGHVQAY